MNRTVSIIMPNYNGKKYISEAVESVLMQTYSDWELIIIDDCSNDGSQEIIRQYQTKDNRIKPVFSSENCGAALSRNKGIAAAQGRYIAFLDSDDIWFPEKLEKQIRFMQEKNVLLCFSSYYKMNGNGDVTGVFRIPRTETTYSDMLKSSIIGNLTAVYDCEATGKFFMENIQHEDYVQWLKMLKRIKKAEGITEPLAKYRVNSSSLSGNKLKAAQWQWNIYRNVEKIGLIPSLYYFMHYAVKGLTKYKKISSAVAE